MSNNDLLSIPLVASVIAAWKILTMSNIPWWVCLAGVLAYALLVLFFRLQKVKRSA